MLVYRHAYMHDDKFLLGSVPSRKHWDGSKTLRKSVRVFLQVDYKMSKKKRKQLLREASEMQKQNIPQLNWLSAPEARKQVRADRLKDEQREEQIAKRTDMVARDLGLYKRIKRMGLKPPVFECMCGKFKTKRKVRLLAHQRECIKVQKSEKTRELAAVLNKQLNAKEPKRRESKVVAKKTKKSKRVKVSNKTRTNKSKGSKTTRTTKKKQTLRNKR